jgi:branched-chain amino acid aminotransferase
MPAGIYDTFLLDQDGYILEGLAANFYAIIDGELLTAGHDVLKGIARQIVLEIAPPIVPVREEAPHSSQIGRFSDAFLTSASRGIIPVVEIDGIRIGQGVPGTLTRQLTTAYQAWVSAHLEEL